jgi:phage-related protein (TIGR01555 family)
MSRRSFGKVQAKPQPATPTARVADSFANFEARVGIQAANQASKGHYTFDLVSRNRIQMEAAYRSSWICGMAVDAVAEDMTRAGIELASDIDPDDAERIHATLEEFQVWDALCDTAKWARLYGGAIAVMLIDGQDVSTPLNLDSIQKDQFKGLLVLDRWLVMPSLQDLVTEYGPNLGKPKFYTVVADGMALRNQRIHYSRVIRLEGLKLPYWQRIAENLWGQSVLERLWDRLLAFDSTTEGAAQLVYKAHLRTYKVKNLRDIIAMGGPAYEALVKQIEMIRRFQSNEGLTLMDSNDEFEAHQYTFSGLDNVLLQFGQQISGALQIPLVRMFGQSPAGLNSSGDSDLRTYYDNVANGQDKQLRPGMSVLLDVAHRSALGRAPDDKFGFEFRTCWQLTDTEKATIAKDNESAISDAYDKGIIGRKTALSELKQSSHKTGVFSTITEEEINAADNDPPDPGEVDISGLGIGTNQGQAPGAEKVAPA